MRPWLVRIPTEKAMTTSSLRRRKSAPWKMTSAMISQSVIRRPIPWRSSFSMIQNLGAITINQIYCLPSCRKYLVITFAKMDTLPIFKLINQVQCPRLCAQSVLWIKLLSEAVLFLMQKLQKSVLRMPRAGISLNLRPLAKLLILIRHLAKITSKCQIIVSLGDFRGAVW